ncbi:MAG: hypothetical protein ACHQHO_10495 [Solirubrobacterales bacterium]
MRLLIWGIVGLSGLGLVIQLIGIHGATNERSAIQHAVRAPFQDLRRHDARALCGDFIPAVAADLTARGRSCAARVEQLFHRSSSETEYLPSHSLLLPGRVTVTSIHRYGDRATADSVGPGSPGLVRHWQLARVDGRWRVATPATLQLQSDCRRRPFGASGCLDVLSMRLGQAQ